MPPNNEYDPARQAAVALSGRLGRLAASSAVRTQGAFPHLDLSITPRLASVLARVRRRAEEHAADRLRANEFMAP
jgi:hypothetical protein